MRLREKNEVTRREHTTSWHQPALARTVIEGDDEFRSLHFIGYFRSFVRFYLSSRPAKVDCAKVKNSDKCCCPDNRASDRSARFRESEANQSNQIGTNRSANDTKANWKRRHRFIEFKRRRLSQLYRFNNKNKLYDFITPPKKRRNRLRRRRPADDSAAPHPSQRYSNESRMTYRAPDTWSHSSSKSHTIYLRLAFSACLACLRYVSPFGYRCPFIKPALLHFIIGQLRRCELKRFDEWNAIRVKSWSWKLIKWWPRSSIDKPKPVREENRIASYGEFCADCAN